MIGYTDRTAGAVEHCESMASSHQGNAPVKEAYDKLADYCKRKLWHQLTMLVLEILQTPATFGALSTPDGTHAFLALYDKVVLCVDSKLNPLSLAKIAALVSHAISATDITAAKAILENLLAKTKDSSSSSSSSASGGGSSTSHLVVPATIYAQSKLASLLLTSSPQDAPASEFASIVAQFQTNQDLLHEYPAEGNSELASVHAAHYEAAMHYYKRIGPPEAFYEHALSYLQHMGPDFGKDEAGKAGTAHQLAVDLILAALTGDGVYNLGQVEQTPVLQLLKDTPDEWLVHLLQATAAGNVTLFKQYEQDYATQIASQPALVHRASAVTEKLTLLALVTLVFHKGSHDRLLKFDEIAQALVLQDMDQVEWIVMRALSVHLMEGTMDQVAQTVNVTWVMPRVLSNDQMSQLATRFGEWASTVSKTQASMTAAIA